MSLRHVLLIMLREKPATGYDLTKTFDERLRHFWQATHQQVYRELATLLSAKLVKVAEVAQRDKPDKKIYRITAAGQRGLQDWLQTPVTARPVNDEILVRLLASDLMEQDGATDLLSREKQTHKVLLEKYLAIEKAVFPTGANEKMSLVERGKYLALRKGIRLERARMEWADEALKLMSG